MSSETIGECRLEMNTSCFTKKEKIILALNSQSEGAVRKRGCKSIMNVVLAFILVWCFLKLYNYIMLMQCIGQVIMAANVVTSDCARKHSVKLLTHHMLFSPAFHDPGWFRSSVSHSDRGPTIHRDFLNSTGVAWSQASTLMYPGIAQNQPQMLWFIN